MSLTRREFIKSSVAGAAAASMSSVMAQPTAVAGKSEVYAGKGTAAEIIPKIIDKAGGIARFVKKGGRVLIKPNMSFASPPEWGANTSPEAVFTLAKMCLDAGAKRVIVCDNTLADPESCKEKSGYSAMLKDIKGVVIFVPKQDAMFVTKTDDRPKYLKTVDVVKEWYQSDAIFSIAAAKTHGASGVSMNIKGLMGLIKDRGIFHREYDMDTAIAEQLFYMKPTFTILDATRALLDNGPGGPGKIADLKTFVGGFDTVAVDSYGVTLAPWYGRTFEGMRVKHIKIASDLGLGNAESSKISVVSV
jgi:uncharacterized protein (DUF362 family)